MLSPELKSQIRSLWDAFWSSVGFVQSEGKSFIQNQFCKAG